MIDPSDVIKFDRTDAELQEWWLFSCIVAGKTAKTMAVILDRFLKGMPGRTPFSKIKRAIKEGTLIEHMERARIGQYNRLSKCFEQSVKLKLRTCTVEDLEAIHGIGPKTARMFLMHSRPNQRLAALDVHVLRHLRANGYPDAPEVTPGSPKVYKLYEDAFLTLADASGLSPSEYDLEVWKMYSVSYDKKAA